MNAHDLIPRLERFRSYDQALREFHPQLPARFNIADALSRSHRDSVTRIALLESRISDDNVYTLGALDYLSNKFANVLRSHNIRQGDKVAVMLDQSAALLVAHLGILKLGGIVLPLATRATQSMTEYALKAVSPRAIIISAEAIDQVAHCVTNISSLEVIFAASDLRSREDFGADCKGFWRETYRASPDFKSVETPISAPALIFPPASADERELVVHAHRLLIGQLPVFEMSNNFDISDDTIFFTPSDWSQVETLFGMLYPALLYGRPVVARPDVTQNTIDLLHRREITNLFISSDELSQLLSETSQHDLRLRNIVTFNSLDQSAELAFDLKPNRVCCARETGVVASTCHAWFDSPAGSQGRPSPASPIEVIDQSGSAMTAGSAGTVAVHRSAASLFLEYLDQPEKTRSAFTGEWFPTEYEAIRDGEGNLRIRRGEAERQP